MERRCVLQACYSFLVPIARFLLRSGVSFREFAEISRVAFVQVATEDYGIRGRPTNISRVAAMTGIARKDVKRVRGLVDHYIQDPRTHLSPLGDVLQQWCSNPEYLDDDGRPSQIPFAGAERSFERLVQISCGDLPAGALKVELVRVGAVEERDNGLLKVVRREIVPEDIDERLFTSLAFSLKALATTIAYNTDPDRRAPPRVERFVQSGTLTAASRARLHNVIRGRVIDFTEELDQLFSMGEITTSSEGGRIGVGVYFHDDSQ